MNTILSGSHKPYHSFAPANLQSASLSRSSLDVRTSTAISLTTADGDKITLSANSATQASFQTYDYQGRLGGRSLAAQGAEFNLSSAAGFSVSVDGSLDQQELADINQLVETIAAVGKDFFAGKGADSLEQLEGLDNLDSITSFQAQLSYARTESAFAASQTAGPAPAHAHGHTHGDRNAGPGIGSVIDSLEQAKKFLEDDKGLGKSTERLLKLLHKLTHQLEHQQTQSGQTTAKPLDDPGAAAATA